MNFRRKSFQYDNTKYGIENLNFGAARCVDMVNVTILQ